MTIIFDTGTFWIDELSTNITVNNAATRYNSGSLNLTRPGHVVGFLCNCSSITNNNDLPATVFPIFDGVNNWSFGLQAFAVTLALFKGVGGNANDIVSVNCFLFMRS